jgi:hypothetical protein
LGEKKNDTHGAILAAAIPDKKLTHMELHAPRRSSTCHSEPVEKFGRKIEGRRVIKKYY